MSSVNVNTCQFCNKNINKTDHHNPELFDVYSCRGCLLPDFNTLFRQIAYPGQLEVLATTIRIDEYFIVINYSFNYTTRRSNYTTIYKKFIGLMESSFDIDPITYDADRPVHDFDTTLDLPLHDPVLLKKKLQLYTLFS